MKTNNSIFELLLQEAPVSWKTIQKSLIKLKDIGDEKNLDNVAKSIGFNNFQEFYQDVYNTLRKDMGGRVYEPNFAELNKIFNFLVKDPQIYKIYKEKLSYYGYHRYLDTDVFNQLLSIKIIEDFKAFLAQLENPATGDLAVNYDRRERIYSDSNIDIYRVKDHHEMETMCVGTTWCVKQKNYFDNYTKYSTFYVILFKKEWYEQNKGYRKKYALRFPILIDENFEKLSNNLKGIANTLEKDSKSLVHFLSKDAIEKKSGHIIEFISNNIDKEEQNLYDLVTKINTLNSVVFKKNQIEYNNLLWSKTKTIAAFYSENIENYIKIEKLIKDGEELLEKNIDGHILANKFQEFVERKIKEYFSNSSESLFGGQSFFDISILAELEQQLSYSELTNNNQNVRIQNFDQLPEPYHSQLKNFDKYKNYLKIREQFNQIKEKSKDIKINEKEVLNELVEIFKWQLINQIKFETIYLENTIRDLKEIVRVVFPPEFKEYKFHNYNDYYFLEIKDEKSFNYFSSVSTDLKRFWNPDYDFFVIFSNKTNTFFIIKVLNKNRIKELEYVINNVLNGLKLDYNKIEKIASYYNFAYAKPIEESIKMIFQESFDYFKSKAESINSIIKRKNSMFYSNFARTNWAILLLDFIQKNLEDFERDFTDTATKFFTDAKNIKMVSGIRAQFNEISYYEGILWRTFKRDYLSLTKALILNAFLSSLILDYSKYNNILKQYSKYLKESVKLPPFGMAEDTSYALRDSESDLVGIAGIQILPNTIENIMKDLSNFEFIVRLKESKKLLLILRALFNIFDRYVVFMDEDEDLVYMDPRSRIEYEPLKKTDFGRFVVIKFNNVIETTKELEIFAKLLEHYDKFKVNYLNKI